MVRYKSSEAKILASLIRKFPDAITHHYNSMELDFVTTVDRFAQRIVETMSPGEIHALFAKKFKYQDEIARYLATYLHDLSEACQNFLDEHCYMEGDDVYTWDEDDTTEDDHYDNISKEDYEF